MATQGQAVGLLGGAEAHGADLLLLLTLLRIWIWIHAHSKHSSPRCTCCHCHCLGLALDLGRPVCPSGRGVSGVRSEAGGGGGPGA